MTRVELLQIAKPILFNTDMVKAILDGRKTVTRQVAIPNEDLHEFRSVKYPNGWWIRGRVCKDWDTLLTVMKRDECKCRYRTGDILYVRETWAKSDEFCGMKNIECGECSGCQYTYRATPDVFFEPDVWHPSIHMPKEAARIFLRVTDVRVERLQDINADGIRNEGLTSMAVHAGDMEIAQSEFALLWNGTVKKSDFDRYGWAANPWVWVIEFEKLEVHNDT